jgi:metallophosphoesterase (TIGR00282 family)
LVVRSNSFLTGCSRVVVIRTRSILPRL